MYCYYCCGRKYVALGANFFTNAGFDRAKQMGMSLS